MKYELCIVIINYKTPNLLIDCLESLKTELNDNTVVAIVDNASNDQSVEVINNWLIDNNAKNSFHLICSLHNGGFSSGNNTGINAFNADHYLLLNSDTLVRKGAISTLLNSMNTDKSIGLVAPRLEWPDGMAQESCFKFHSPVSEFIASAKTGAITRLLQHAVVPQPVSDSAHFYDWVSFACVMIRADVIQIIGLMDDHYFMYFEDVEYCYRAKKAGWQIKYEPAAHVVHLRGGTSPVKAQAKLRKRIPRYFYESRTRYFFQVYGRIGLFLANSLWTLGWMISSLRSCFSKNYLPDVSEKQWLDIWTNFFNPEKPYLHPEKYGK
jgi:N-acetylglucosaminyl-diphospho-decaprenol L-rhamnosyltransferase